MSILLGSRRSLLGRGVYGAMMPLRSLQSDFDKLCLNEKFTEDSSEDEIDVPVFPHSKRTRSPEDMGQAPTTKVLRFCNSADKKPSLSNLDASNSVQSSPVPRSEKFESSMREVLPGGAQFLPCPEGDPDTMQFKSNVEIKSYDDVNAIVATVESFYTQVRPALVIDNRVVSTPLHALKVVSNKYDEELSCSTYLLPETSTRYPTYRVEIYIGVFRGLGECRFKRIAAQMAALDALLKIENSIERPGIIPYTLLPGWRLKSRVLKDAVDLCRKNGLPLPRYVMKSNVGDATKPPIRVELFIGHKQLGIGESETGEIARKLAAKNFLESLTETEYPEEEVAMGSLCTPYSELIKENLKLHVTPAKYKWLFEMSDRGVSDEARGVDPIERDSISNQHQQETLKVQINGYGHREVTFEGTIN